MCNEYRVFSKYTGFVSLYNDKAVKPTHKIEWVFTIQDCQALVNAIV